MSGIKLDTIDRRILRALQENGRLSNVELADKVNLTPSPCLRRLRRLEDSGVIEGYSAILNRRQAGLGMTVFVDLKVARHSEESALDLEQRVRMMPEVTACHLISGEADYRLEIVVPDLEAYERFNMTGLLKLPLVNEIRSSFVIRTVRAHGSLSLDHLG